MRFRHRWRRAADRAIGNLLLPSSGLVLRAISCLPQRWAFVAAAARGRRRYHRSRANGRLGAILGECLSAKPEQVESWSLRAFEHASCDELEWALLSRIDRASLPRYVDLRGLDHLQRTLEEGRGAILYSAHVRGHLLFFGALGLLGFKPTIIGYMQRLPDTPARTQRVWDRRDALLRDRMGCHFLYVTEDDFMGVRAANALRRNEVVVFVIDHSHSRQNIEVPFLGRKARFPVGPLLVARSTGAPLLHFWLHRPAERTPLIAEIGEPIYVSSDLNASLRTLVAPLERCIRMHPDSWATWLFPHPRLWVEEG